MLRPTTIRVSVAQTLRTRPPVEGPVEVRDITLSAEDAQWIIDTQNRLRQGLPYERVDTHVRLIFTDESEQPTG